MNNNITKHPDLIKKEKIIKDLQQQIKKKQTTLKSLKTRLQNMQKDVEEISRKVQNQVMQKMEQLDKLREEIAELAKKLKKSKNISPQDKQALMEMADEFGGDDEMLGEGYKSYKEHKSRMESGDFDFDENERARMRDFFQEFQVKPPEEELRSIRKVWMKLSQKFHPDLAKSKQEEEEFHKMQQQINEAYQRNDIHALLELERMYLLEDFDFNNNAITIDVLNQEIERLKKELKFITNQCNRTSKEVKNLRQSNLGTILTEVGRAKRAGEGLEEMTAEQDKIIDILTQMRDALAHSVEIDGVSPKMIQMMMDGAILGGMQQEGMEDIEDLMNEMMASKNPPNEEDLMEIMNKIMQQSGSESGGDIFDFEDLFNFYEEENYEVNENPKFPIGSSVRVKSNRKHDSDEKTKMKNWEGRIAAAYFDEDGEETYMVSFDSETINQMPKSLIQDAVDYGEKFEEHAFLVNELIPAQPRDKKVAAFAAYRKRFHQQNYGDLPKAQATRIRKIMLNNVSLTDAQNWEKYLNQHLKFPFSAKTKGVYALTGGLTCQVYGIEYFDEDNGFIMSIKPRDSKQRILYPLVDLEVTGKGDKKMKELVTDYGEWGEETLEI